jgi:hypothetical protein
MRRVRHVFSIGIGPRIVVLLLGLAAPAPVVSPADLPAEAEVVVATLDVFDAPDDAAMASGRLQKSNRVTVRDVIGPAWLAIDPPPSAFCWVEEAALAAADAQGHARVTAPSALVRSGHPLARMPGAPQSALATDTVVKLLKYSPLVVGEGAQRRTWRAIEPPKGDVRYIHAAGVRVAMRPETQHEAGPGSEVSGGLRPRLAAPAPAAEIQVAYAPPQPPSERPVAPDVADAIARIESLHRAALRTPVEQWHLDEVRGRYETLLKSVIDSAAGSAIRARLDEVGRQEAIARDAREIETLLARSRRRDATVTLAQRRLADTHKPLARAYDVEGLIQASSRKVDGRKVFALIGRDGATQAYLDIPPGIDVKGLMTHRVGVRGAVHYNEMLRARVISVREVEALDARREGL